MYLSLWAGAALHTARLTGVAGERRVGALAQAAVRAHRVLLTTGTG